MDAALKALAEPRRREILRLIWSVEMPASHIASRLDDFTRPAISQHLGVLRGADLIIERRDGAKRLYRANHDEMPRLRKCLDDFWSQSLGRLRDLAEAAEATSQEAHVAQEKPREARKRTTDD